MGFSGSACQYEDEDTSKPSLMKALFDDSVVLIFYACMLLLIGGLFYGSYRLYQAAHENYRRHNENQQAQVKAERDDKFTDKDSGKPVKESRYADFQ